MKGRERLLDKRCGTLPYVAPEVLTGTYKAQPADTWSCGIILTAMLAGGKFSLKKILFRFCSICILLYCNLKIINIDLTAFYCYCM